jgi:hypothetical protein
LFLKPSGFKTCLENLNNHLAAATAEHVICEGNQYMLVKMPLDAEDKLKKLNEKN